MKKKFNWRIRLAKWLTLHDPRVQSVETTSEAKSVLPVIYSKWARRLGV